MAEPTREGDFEALADAIYMALPFEGGTYEAAAENVAAKLVAAGWIGPEPARWAKADLENAREAGEVYRQRAEKAEAETAEWKRIATGFETLLNRYKRDNRIGTQVSDALLRVRELAAKMKGESGQSWNSVSGQRILNALAGESNG